MEELIAVTSILYASTSAALFLCEAKEQNKKVNKRREWIKHWRQNRDSSGSYHFLTQELRLQDKQAYRGYLRMDADCFQEILNLIKTDITRQDTVLRKAVSAEEKLSLTLRFLATGESFRSLEYQTRLSLSLISNCIPEVCHCIYKKLKEKFLKVNICNNLSQVI